jgi:pimeloyl-ACP methyl ester carboxylesterase
MFVFGRLVCIIRCGVTMILSTSPFISRGARTLLLLGACFLTACAPDPPTTLLEPDANRSGALGELGPLGAFVHKRTFRVRVDESVETDIIVPGQTADTPVLDPQHPVILIPGGGVDTDRYHWMAAHIASRGFTVISPNFALFSLLQQGDIYDSFQSVRIVAQDTGDPLSNVVDRHAPALVMGHSLGGVSAAKLWASQPEDISHLALIASTTDTSDDYSSRLRFSGSERILSIIGTADVRVPEDDARVGLKTFTAPVTFVAVDGMIHYHVVTNPTASELATDGKATIDESQARFLTMFMIDALLEDFRQGSSDTLDKPDAWPMGILPIAR